MSSRPKRGASSQTPSAGMSTGFSVAPVATSNFGIGGGVGGFGATATSNFGAAPQAAQPQQPQEPPTYDKLDTSAKDFMNRYQKILFEYRELAESLSHRTPERIDQVTEQADFELDAVALLGNSIKTESEVTKANKDEFQRLTRNMDLIAGVLERVRNGMDPPPTRFPSKFFKDLAEEFGHRMHQHQQSLDSLEKFLETAQEKHEFTPAMLKETMKNQLEYFLALSAHVSQYHKLAVELQNIYLARRRAEVGVELENPFMDEAERKKRAEAEKRRKQQIAELMRQEELRRMQQTIQQQQQQTPAKPGTTGTTGFGSTAGTFGSTGGFGTSAGGFSTGSTGGTGFGFGGTTTTGTATPGFGTTATTGTTGATAGAATGFGFGTTTPAKPGTTPAAGTTGAAPGTPATFGGNFATSTPATGAPAAGGFGTFGATGTPGFGTPAAGGTAAPAAGTGGFGAGGTAGFAFGVAKK